MVYVSLFTISQCLHQFQYPVCITTGPAKCVKVMVGAHISSLSKGSLNFHFNWHKTIQRVSLLLLLVIILSTCPSHSCPNSIHLPRSCTLAHVQSVKITTPRAPRRSVHNGKPQNSCLHHARQLGQNHKRKLQKPPISCTHNIKDQIKLPTTKTPSPPPILKR